MVVYQILQSKTFTFLTCCQIIGNLVYQISLLLLSNPFLETLDPITALRLYITLIQYQVLLEDHIKKKHPSDVITSTKVSCQHCGRTVTNAKSLRLHILAKHNRQECPFKCDICEKKFPRNSLLVRHVSKVHKNCNNKLVHCPTCGDTFKNELKLREHIDNNHKIEENVAAEDVVGEGL